MCTSTSVRHIYIASVTTIVLFDFWAVWYFVLFSLLIHCWGYKFTWNNYSRSARLAWLQNQCLNNVLWLVHLFHISNKNSTRFIYIHFLYIQMSDQEQTAPLINTWCYLSVIGTLPSNTFINNADHKHKTRKFYHIIN